MKRFLFALLFSCACISVNAQVNYSETLKQLKSHITTLASDEYGGRLPGTVGETLSFTYIINQFNDIGIQPKGENGFLQPFTFTNKILMGKDCYVNYGKNNLIPNTDFFVSPFSANKSVNASLVDVGYGIIAPNFNHNDYDIIKGNLKGKIFLMNDAFPDGASHHSKFADVGDYRTRIDSAIAKGALGVIFYSISDFTQPDYSKKITASSIPVIVVDGKYKEKLLNSKFPIDIKTELQKEEAIGHNVIGFIDNHQENTVVIGAHYDHLGNGGHESLYRGEPQIHNGADDNASGVAAMIELARIIKASNLKDNNYLFMAYSGEEKGLLGSGYFVKHPTLALDKINYMINMDMVGRLKTEDPILLIHGAGTSDAWKITFNYIHVDSLKIKTTESGVGPSDHTSFYLKDIPVLHFFSGTHSDYHKPSDDEHLINYDGEIKIIQFIYQLVERLNDKGKLNFQKTKEDSNEDAPKFKVTMGVVPDYAFEGEGMRIDGVSDGKPAAKAGLKAGDIVMKINDISVVDMMSYMKALGKFNKGDTVTVTFIRNKETQELKLTF